MRSVIVRYRVKPDRAGENENLIRGVYDELHRAAPAGFRYATYRMEDGVSFVHFAIDETDDGHNPLNDLSAFGAFQEHIGDRCDEPPVVSELRRVGSYRLGDDD
jgi:hypothetical protein